MEYPTEMKQRTRGSGCGGSGEGGTGCRSLRRLRSWRSAWRALPCCPPAPLPRRFTPRPLSPSTTTAGCWSAGPCRWRCRRGRRPSGWHWGPRPRHALLAGFHGQHRAGLLRRCGGRGERAAPVGGQAAGLPALGSDGNGERAGARASIRCGCRCPTGGSASAPPGWRLPKRTGGASSRPRSWESRAARGRTSCGSATSPAAHPGRRAIR